MRQNTVKTTDQGMALWPYYEGSQYRTKKKSKKKRQNFP